MSEPRLLDAETVAERLGMSARWVLAEARAGRLPHYRLGRRVRFDAAEIVAFVAAHHRPRALASGLSTRCGRETPVVMVVLVAASPS